MEINENEYLKVKSGSVAKFGLLLVKATLFILAAIIALNFIFSERLSELEKSQKDAVDNETLKQLKNQIYAFEMAQFIVLVIFALGVALFLIFGFPNDSKLAPKLIPMMAYIVVVLVGPLVTAKTEWVNTPSRLLGILTIIFILWLIGELCSGVWQKHLDIASYVKNSKKSTSVKGGSKLGIFGIVLLIVVGASFSLWLLLRD